MTVVASSSAPPFRSVADLIGRHAEARSGHPAIVAGDDRVSYGELDAAMDRIAASLQRDGLGPGDVIALCAAPSTRYAALFLGALRAGVVVAPLAPSVTPASFASMLDDSQARLLFVDATASDALAGHSLHDIVQVSLDEEVDRIVDRIADKSAFDDWLVPGPVRPAAVDVQSDWPFNIIYSSGTTGSRKASCSRTRCAGRMSRAASTIATTPTA